jgi:hypothetical protein
LFALQTTENLATRQAGFAADKEHSDDEVVWDDGKEDDDAGSNVAAEGSSTSHGDDGSEELEDSGEPLSYSSKFPGPPPYETGPRMMMMNQGRLSPRVQAPPTVMMHPFT